MSGSIEDSALKAFITERNLALIALDESYVARTVPKRDIIFDVPKRQK